MLNRSLQPLARDLVSACARTTKLNLTAAHPSSLGMSSLIQDLRHALRQLWRRPGFTLTAVLTLAIGIGVNAVAFTVVNGVLFQSWSSSTGDDVGRIETIPGGDEGGHASVEEYRRFAEATRGTTSKDGTPFSSQLAVRSWQIVGAPL